MTIEHHEGRCQVCCDRCPGAYPNAYAREDFDVMIADARTAGWKIVKARVDPGEGEDTDDLFAGRQPTGAPRIAGRRPRQGYLHICPDCWSDNGTGEIVKEGRRA